MLKMLKIITIIMTSSSLAWANCPKPVTHLEQGSIVPCEGYLFSPEKEQEVYYKLERIKTLEEINQLQEERFNHTKQALDDYVQYGQELEKAHRKQAITNDITKIIYFVAGMTLMYLGTKAAQ